jgi:predicted 2-oxoglutarate/Fe(II)-dependent dioxygenase YbiX
MEVEELDGPRLYVVRGFLSPEDCEGHIVSTEKVGYGEAPITTAAGFVMRKDIRNNERVIIDDEPLAGELFALAKPVLPAEWFGWSLVGLNERFRYYRYDPGQKFELHTDGYYERPSGERSHLTFMVYLNDEFEGGETVFYHKRPHVAVKPERGMALVFYHRLGHEGAAVIRGRKYVLRSDVMYRRAAE